jgi:DNA-binding CsgD family transcriptional regulator
VLAAVPLLAAAAHGRAPSAWDDGAALVEAAAYGDFAGGLAVALGDEHALAGHGGAVRHHGMVRAYLDGDWDEALARAREIERLGRGGVPHGVRGPARALAAEMHTLRGDLGRARAWLALIPDTVAHPLVVRARLGVRYWSGPEGEAYAHTWRDFRRAVGEGRFAGAERVLLRILLFAVTSRPARPQEAWRALDRLAELHEEAPTVLTREALLAARGLLHRDEAAARAAHESARRRGDLPMTLYCCQALVEVADDPRPWLAETAAHSRRMAIGGPLRTLLGRSAQRRNARLPRHRSAPEGLGEADLRLIRMVSQGATNRQIAARLACSEKTVEQRLARLFQRTGSRSRVELAAAWLDGTLERAGSDVRTGTSASHPSP